MIVTLLLLETVPLKVTKNLGVSVPFNLTRNAPPLVDAIYGVGAEISSCLAERQASQVQSQIVPLIIYPPRLDRTLLKVVSPFFPPVKARGKENARAQLNTPL